MFSHGRPGLFRTIFDFRSLDFRFDQQSKIINQKFFSARRLPISLHRSG
jgi:hypothetical protein